MAMRGQREEPRKKFICKHCKVEVISKTNFGARYPGEHGKSCPRKNR